MKKRFVLVLGGARSGKSRFAQQLASRLGKKVLFVATGSPSDEEMQRRIEAHKRKRPARWRTLEVGRDVAKKLAVQIEDAEVVLLDCVTLRVGNCMVKGKDISVEEPAVRKKVLAEVRGLINCAEEHSVHFILVSNEVGLGLVPAYPSGRLYRDLLGEANQLLAARASEVYLMLSGIPLKVKG